VASRKCHYFLLLHFSKVLIKCWKVKLDDFSKTYVSAQCIQYVVSTSNVYNLQLDIHKWVDTRLDYLNISNDGLDRRMFASITGHNKFDTILVVIYKAISLNIEVKINAVLINKYNKKKLHNFHTWLKTTPAALMLIELMGAGAIQHSLRETMFLVCR
jgi:molybdenum cofactor biosynthesis enzyme MoaA